MIEDTHEGIDGGGALVRQEQGGPAPIQRATFETASSAVAAQARAEVEARCLMAWRRPRDWLQVRHNILKDCERPRFAETARYHKPIGKGVEGPSVRFADAYVRHMTNVLVQSIVTFDDPEKRIIRVEAMDLENNVSHFKDVVISKVVERSSAKGREQIGQPRMNSEGRLTYSVRATDDDLLNKENALESKARRNVELRLCPGDILEEAMDKAIETVRNQAAKDPDAERKQMVDAFARMGVQPKDLAAYLGHSVDQINPATIVRLRAVYSSLKDGETTWSEIVEAEGAKRDKPAGDKPEPAKTLADLTRAPAPDKGSQP
jgi:hypothetical protein